MDQHVLRVITVGLHLRGVDVIKKGSESIDQERPNNEDHS
jgi:hypothetical protein